MDQIARTAKQIGASIRRRRRTLDLRQSDVGDKANLRQATISALENGESGIRLRTLIDVMAALDLELVIRERSRAIDIEDIF